MYVFIDITWFVISFYKPLLSSSPVILEIINRKGKGNKISLFPVLHHGSKEEYIMKSMSGTAKTKGLCPLWFYTSKKTKSS